MKILFVYKEDYPWDVRVEKIVDTLTESGHSVTIISNNIAKYSSIGTVNGNRIYRLPPLKILPEYFSRFIKLPLWFNPVWVFTFWSLLRKYEYEVVIVRDLPLLKLATIFKKKYEYYLIYDMAEVYPEMYGSIRQFEPFSLKDFILKNPRQAARYEKANLKSVDHTFAMIEESRDRLIRKGVDPSSVSIVSNTPQLDKYHGMVMDHVGRKLRIVYVGRITRLRGLDLLISGVQEFLALGNSRDDIRVDIVGTGPAKSELVEMVDRLGLEDCVTIHGWLEQSEVDSIMTIANVGVSTYRVCGHWNHTIPNKIFDYMLAGLPVLTTPVTTIGRIINSVGCGIVTQSESALDIGRALESLKDPDLRNRLGKSGHSAVVENYNWGLDKIIIEDVVSSLDCQKYKDR